MFPESIFLVLLFYFNNDLSRVSIDDFLLKVYADVPIHDLYVWEANLLRCNTSEQIRLLSNEIRTHLRETENLPGLPVPENATSQEAFEIDLKEVSDTLQPQEFPLHGQKEFCLATQIHMKRCSDPGLNLIDAK